MASGPRQPRPPDERPRYTKYRARPGFLSRLQGGGSALDALRRRDPRDPGGPRTPGRDRAPRVRKPISWGRVAKWVALALVAWFGTSAVLFLVSAQIESGKISGE